MNVGSVVGLARLATIKEIDTITGSVRIIINDSKSDVLTYVHTASIFGSWGGTSGEFAGGYPTLGSTVWVVQVQGGSWTIVSWGLPDGTFANSSSSAISGFRKNLMSAFKPGRHLIQVKNNIRQILDPELGLQQGNPVNFIHVDPVLNIFSNRFDFNMEFTEAHRKITGPVMRDVKINATRNISGSALTSHSYNQSLYEVGLDPKTRTGDSFTRNPGLNESREIIYEFRNSFGFTDDLREQKIYDSEEIVSQDNFFPRDESRADALGLSLVNPNHLLEIIKGTVVDINGNIVDLNRNIIPMGAQDSLSLRDNENNASQTFINLRRELRKSLAFHFEVNARKDESPDLNNIDYFLGGEDYARLRSRFAFDIDKEGQFKLNVPSSSETGNVGLPVRNENYSVISASENDTNPRQFVRNVDSQDQFLDSFGKGVITLSGSQDSDIKGYATAIDRITETTIKLGTVFHDLSKTLTLHNVNDPYVPAPLYPKSKLNLVPKVKKIFEPNITVSGDKANAGGRSGTITLDGHLSMSIGANTVDRQSLWLDCAGGVVSNIGRDVNNVSMASRFDGDVLVQIGGETITDDSRFKHLNNAYREGALDIRVAAGGQMTIVRIDKSGVRIYTPGELDLAAEGHVRIQSRKGNLYLDGEGIYMYANDHNTGRAILRKPGKSID